MKRASQPSRTRVIGLLALAWLTSLRFTQTTDKTPAKGNASIQIAMDEARAALKHYQTALASVRGLPQIGPTVREDSQVVLASRNTVDWLRGKVDLEGAVVPSEFEGLLDSIDGARVQTASIVRAKVSSGIPRRGRCIATAKVLHPTFPGYSSSIHDENDSGSKSVMASLENSP